MKVFLSSTFLDSLLHSNEKEKVKNLLLTSIDSNTRFYTSAYSLHCLFSMLGTIDIEQKRMILRNIEDLVDAIFVLSIEDIRSELLFVESLGLEQVIALNQGIDVFYLNSEEETKTHPLLKVRNFFRETK
ncbi:MAG: hypothetical protein ACO1NV_03685 [Leptospira bouyouniensis]|uniref:PIN domain-containing protein n=1 Tax=Leptospira bouyouniensis TaxID=2484911 RepID=A0A7I0INL5_9LEPT|nr:hypothetical protein [Leptospira bouyouniensis]TGK52368.1 hypothetical protein EHQ10_01040 [Leptospira bouyouniensis]TGL04831.1 hypothetical protein EHQ43_11115 [Leptospira bouyouniensis]TGM74648.1 hypothetical protein EHQ99_18495 [Leptospira bouyouniensis]